MKILMALYFKLKAFLIYGFLELFWCFLFFFSDVSWTILGLLNKSIYNQSFNFVLSFL